MEGFIEMEGLRNIEGGMFGFWGLRESGSLTSVLFPVGTVFFISTREGSICQGYFMVDRIFLAPLSLLGLTDSEII